MARQIDMTHGPIFSKLMMFSVPLIFSSLLQLLFNAADMVVVGRFAGDTSLAAVGSNGPIINLLVNILQGLSIGSNVVAAHYFGAGKDRELNLTVHTTMTISLIGGAILTVTGVFGARGILSIMGAPSDVLELASLYLRIFFGGIITSVIYNFGSALLRAKGDTLRPLIILTAAGFVNVGLNLLFVINFKMDVAGVALATVISQGLSAAAVVIILMKEDGPFKLNLRKLGLDSHIFVRIVKVGLPAGLQGIIFSGSNVIIQSAVNSFGKTVIAGSSAAGNIEGFVYMAMNGIAQGALTFTSQNLGAGEKKRIRKVVITAMIVVTVVGLAFGNAVYLNGRTLLGFYSKSPEVIDEGMIRLMGICILYFLCGTMDVMSNSIRGAGHSLLPMIVSVAGVCGIRIIYIFTFFRIPRFHSPLSLFLSYPISWLVTVLIHVGCFISVYRKIPDESVESIESEKSEKSVKSDNSAQAVKSESAVKGE